MSNADLSDIVIFEPGQIVGIPFGDCLHGCKHNQRALVAIGPDADHLKLLRCISPECTRESTVQCRAWFSDTNNRRGAWRSIWLREES